jgi:hypothetical protein
MSFEVYLSHRDHGYFLGVREKGIGQWPGTGSGAEQEGWGAARVL